jgi:DNA-binding transcriptional MerR regulator
MMAASTEGGTNGTLRQRPGARPPKSAAAFRTISEVATELDVAQHVLRFWESKFPQVRPLKRGGGRRYYRPEDIDLLRQIRSLLYDEGYTIKGAQKLLKGHKRAADDHEVDEPQHGPSHERQHGPQHELLLDDADDAPPPVAVAAPALAPEVRIRLRRLRDELAGLRTALAHAAAD